MAAIDLVLRHVVDDDGLAAVADFVADRRSDLEFAAGLETERDLVADGAGDPSVLRHPRNRRESHSRGTADDFKDRRDGVDLDDSRQVVSKVILQRRLLANSNAAGRMAPATGKTSAYRATSASVGS